MKDKKTNRAQKSTDLLKKMMNLEKMADGIMKSFSSESSCCAIVSSVSDKITKKK